MIGSVASRVMVWAALGLLAVLALTGCAAPPDKGPGPKGESLSADQFVQNDINRVQTLVMRDNLDSLVRLLDKLYRRNPAEWRKAGFTDLKSALAQGDTRIRKGEVPKELEGLQDIEVLSVAMDPRYPGDRAAAFVLGLSNMIIAAHGGLTRFHVGDSVDARHVFNAARNVEIAAWMLSSRRDARGQPLLLSNELGNGVTNLSFEREFGRMIARLDLVAELQDESVRRIGIGYLQGLLFFNFLPVR
ncbi:hypothetical protein [Castellaniella sp. MT123]|uniref:hypothetical protein n=1 Tax=Castellaniella sp. MT123 TaxID=3140381 RepID=UPI0031F42C2B